MTGKIPQHCQIALECNLGNSPRAISVVGVGLRDIENPGASCVQLADVPKAPLLPTQGKGGLRNGGGVEAGV